MIETGIPGHIQHNGRQYVVMELFEAANTHVLEQGVYCNQLIATLNDQGSRIRKLEAERTKLARDLDTARGELAECRRTQAAMRHAVYRAAEKL